MTGLCLLCEIFRVGCVGGVCGLANVLGKEVCDVEALFKSGNHEEAKLLQHRLVSPNLGVSRSHVLIM